MSASFRRLLTALSLFVLAFAMTGCPLPVSERPLPPLPDLEYVYGPEDVIPEYAQMVSPEEFSRLWQSGAIILTGAKSVMESEAREQAQDDEDRRTIKDYQDMHGGIEILANRPLDTSGDTSRQGDGSVRTRFQVEGTNELREVINMGDRFRLRAVARSIREFAQRRNQAEIYEQLYNGLDDNWRRGLNLPQPEDTSSYSWSELLDLNNEITRNWPQIIGTLDFQLEPTLPPACSAEEGSGNRTDGNGNRDWCGYDANGVMMNYNWPGKQHISCVKDQANRGTCPAFASISTMEYHIHRQYERRVNLSEQALYARMKLTWGNGQHFGDGYWPNDGFNQSFTEGYLVPWEEQWNYNPSTSRFTGSAGYTSSCNGYEETCSNSTHQTRQFCTTLPFTGSFCGFTTPDVNPQDWGFRTAGGTTNYYDPADRELSLGRMILAVLLRAQVVWSFDVARSSFTPDTAGYVTYSSAGDGVRGGHAVHVVGMISNERLARIIPNAPAGSGGGYFIIKNSWSNCWGDGGFAYIPFDSVIYYTLEMVSAPSVM